MFAFHTATAERTLLWMDLRGDTEMGKEKLKLAHLGPESLVLKASSIR